MEVYILLEPSLRRLLLHFCGSEREFALFEGCGVLGWVVVYIMLEPSLRRLLLHFCGSGCESALFEGGGCSGGWWSIFC